MRSDVHWALAEDGLCFHKDAGKEPVAYHPKMITCPICRRAAAKENQQ